MKTVFVVRHLHVLPPDEEDVKLIGVYSTFALARAAVDRLRLQPGFKDQPSIVNPELDDDRQGFYIDEYRVDTDHWTEGYEAI
jgi:homoserine kinase type II